MYVICVYVYIHLEWAHAHQYPSFAVHATGADGIIAREGAEEYSRMLPEVLPSGAVVEEQEIKGMLGGLSSHQSTPRDNQRWEFRKGW